MLFEGQIVYFIKDRYDCIHMLKRKSKSSASLEKYIDFVQLLENEWKSNFIKAYVINLEEPEKPYVWSSVEWRSDLNNKISSNHQKYLRFLDDNRGNIIFIGPYKSMRTKGIHLCSRGHEWFVQPIKIKGGETCPKCKKKYRESDGAKYITELLAEMRVEFIKEVSMDRFGHESKLRLDFLVCKNHHPLFVIEFNGVQHYRPIRNEFFGGYEGYRNRMRLDRNKRTFCWSIGLPVVDIPYNETEDQIKETVYYFLRLFDVISSEDENYWVHKSR